MDGEVNSESDLLGNLVKKDAKEITIENTIGPNEDAIRITYRRGITAGDILVELDMANDYVLANAEGELSLGDVIPLSTELMLIPGSIAWGTKAPSVVRRTLYDALLNDLTDGTSLSIKQLSKKLFAYENHLTQVGLSLSKNQKNLGIEVFQLLYELDNLDDNDPNFRAEDLTKLKQEKIPIINLYISDKIYSGLILDLVNAFYDKVFLKSKNPNEKLMYLEILNGINKKISDIDLKIKLQGNSFYMSNPNLDAYCVGLWGPTYRSLQVELSQNRQRTNGILRNRLKNIIGFNNKLIDYNSIKGELIAIGDIKNSKGSVIDLNGKTLSNYDMVYLLLGRQDSFGGTKPNHNLLHLLEGHFESYYLQSDFSKIGLTDPTAVAELIFDVIESQQGVEVDSYLHRVVYKLEYHNKIEYLVIGLKEDKSIHTAFLARDKYKRNTLSQFSIFNTIDPFLV